MPGLESWIALTMVPDVGPVAFGRLLAVYGSPDAIFGAPLKDLAAIEGIGEKKARNINGFSGWKDAERQVDNLNRMDVSAVTLDSPEYPAMLRQIADAPAVLYVKGSLKGDDKFAIALVGPRKPTPYGSSVAEGLSTGLAESGFTVVSGMARGIDTIAHVSSIRTGGRTIAVLGSGIDMPYPPENRGLMKKIADSGCVVSEFPLGTKPLRENFPARNRVISGLSLGVVVVEATRDSGSLITAGCALEQNREVFAVPGNINSLNSAGTNELIRKGAKLVQTPEDIIEELAPVLKGYIKKRERPGIEITGEDKKVCDILTGEPKHIDVISRELAVSSAKALAVLLSLELKGIVKQADGKRFYLAL